MSEPVTIENERLRLTLYPGYGGKVTSLIDKSDGYDLLFAYPHDVPTQPHYDINYGDGWYAGWDECFPGIDKGPYPGRPYEGIEVPDHGELWGLPTQTTASRDEAITQWRGIRFSYNLTRRLRLNGDVMEAQYTLRNHAPFNFHFVWAMHSLMRLDQAVELNASGDRAWRHSHDAAGTAINRNFSWPTTAGDDVSRPNDLPPGAGWKVFSTSPIDRPFVISYPQRQRTLEIAYASDSGIAGYWGIWINTGGWAGHRHFAVEPSTGRHDKLDASVRDRSAALAPPNGQVSWRVSWRVGAA